MKSKKIEDRMRAVREVLDINISDQSFIHELNSLGVDVAYAKVGDPFGPFEFKAKMQRLAEACSVAFLLGRFTGRREMVDVTLQDVDAEKREQAIKDKKRGCLGGDASRKKAIPRHDKILNAYAEWASMPKNVKSANTVFAVSFAAKKKKRKNERGFGKTTIFEVISAFDARVVDVWRDLRTSSSDQSMAVVGRIVGKMNGQPGVSRDTVRRAIGP